MSHPESRWTHPLCDACFAVVRKAHPHRIVPVEWERCCRCGEQTSSGIYYRGDALVMQFDYCPADRPVPR